MVKPVQTITAPVDQASIAQMQARAQRRRALGYRNVPVPAGYLETLLEIAAKAVKK